MIPKDLIEFVRDNRPEVLPGKLLVTIAGYNTWLLRHRDESYERYISPDEAAALLANWLDEELGKCATYKYETLQYVQTWVRAVFVDGDVKATSYNKLSALWQAYKKVKGIQ